jgi:hypothetical protein
MWIGYDGLVPTHVSFQLSINFSQSLYNLVDPFFTVTHTPSLSSTLSLSYIMVLQANAANKRPASENAVASKNENLAVRNFRTSFHAAAIRRRARNHGPKTTKYAVEQAKRRSIIRSPSNIIRISFPMNPPPSPAADVEMKDASPPSRSPTVPVQFPLYLGRPEYLEVPKASIQAIDPELAKADISYIRDTLMASTMGPRYVEPPTTRMHH